MLMRHLFITYAHQSRRLPLYTACPEKKFAIGATLTFDDLEWYFKVIYTLPSPISQK